MIHNLCNITC